jgi:hypothetical protein
LINGINLRYSNNEKQSDDDTIDEEEFEEILIQMSDDTEDV